MEMGQFLPRLKAVGFLGVEQERFVCEWIPRARQARNTRKNRMLTAFGETKCLAEWVEDTRCKVGRMSLETRLRFGWDEERAIATPPTR